MKTEMTKKEHRKLKALERAVETLLDLIEERPELKQVLSPSVDQLESEITALVEGLE